MSRLTCAKSCTNFSPEICTFFLLTDEPVCGILKLQKRKENKEMTKEEIKKRIDSIRDDEFYLQMKDRWSNEDYELSRKYSEEIVRLRKLLEEA